MKEVEVFSIDSKTLQLVPIYSPTVNANKPNSIIGTICFLKFSYRFDRPILLRISVLLLG
jgi:hypothetical protein